MNLIRPLICTMQMQAWRATDLAKQTAGDETAVIIVSFVDNFG